jgi:c-di-GMP-binding flagellar brake protein YcgR
MNATLQNRAGVISHSPVEIARVLEGIMRRHSLLAVYGAAAVFRSLLRDVDSRVGRIVFERSPDAAANEALLGRARATFHCELPGWHVEFVAAEPRATLHDGAQAIECRFPELLSSYQRREHDRAAIRPPLPLRVLADAEGFTPFGASVVDIASGGVGFIVYSQSINLEPGTLLRGCRIELPNAATCTVNLEVRHSEAVSFASGTRAMRSGCRFVGPSPELVALVKRYIGEG